MEYRNVIGRTGRGTPLCYLARVLRMNRDLAGISAALPCFSMGDVVQEDAMGLQHELFRREPVRETVARCQYFVADSSSGA